MKCFLVSNIMADNSDDLNPANGLVDNLRMCIPDESRALFVCSSPDEHEKTAYFAKAVKSSFEASGFTFDKFNVLDRRNQAKATNLVNASDLIILAGGHVPTQNRFFSEIHLKELLSLFEGVLIGISAGSMNAASVVYAHPELEGEAKDPSYQKFIPGLGLTDKMIIPHYQMIKNDVLDGLRVMEDIAYPDSMNKKFYALVDGSYVYLDGSTEKIYGKAYLIADGQITKISSTNEIFMG